MNVSRELGLALQAFQKGNLREAESKARLAMRRHPGDPFAPYLLGLVIYKSGDPAAGAKILSGVADRLKHDAEAQFNIGLVFLEQGRLLEAEQALQCSLTVAPKAETFYNLGIAFRRQDKNREASEAYRRAITMNPAYADAHNNLGEALIELGSFAEARESLARALELNPGLAIAHNNLGKAFSLENRLDEAIYHFERSLSLNPQSALTLGNIGLAFQFKGDGDKAAAAFRQALRFRPGYLVAKWNLCMNRLRMIYRNNREVESARGNYRIDLEQLEQSCSLDTPQAVAEAAEAVGATQPFFLAYQGKCDRELQAKYGTFLCRIMAARYPHWLRMEEPQSPRPGEPIRVGFVSRFFYRHSVWKIPVKGWVEGMDHSRFRLTAYHTGPEQDDQTAEAKRLFHEFVQGPRSLEEWCSIIRNDAPHVLIFPEIGMDPMTVRIASLRHAPVQCSTWGHPDTTGLPTVDYYFSSDLMEPPGAQEHYTEQLVRLPNLSICYTPPASPGAAFSRPDLGLPEDAVLFACCQSLSKYLPAYDEVFPRIARIVQGCRLVFLEYRNGTTVNRVFRERLEGTFAAHGLSRDDFCIFLPHLDFPRFDALMRLSDVFLDSLGWSGCNTALEAITHNLPLITTPGEVMRARHTAAILAMMGLQQYAVGSIDDYVALAAELGCDAERRSEARAEIARRKHLLYRDRTCIEALERFLVTAVHEGGPWKKSVGEGVQPPLPPQINTKKSITAGNL